MWVDSIVPEYVLLRQGKYVQTCAHIEKMLWYILFCAEGYDVEKLEDVNAALSQRKVTGKLMAGLRRAIKAGKIEQHDRLAAVLDEIDRDIDNRHMAVHGAWLMQPEGTLVCEYFKNLGTKKQPDWRPYSAPISVEQLDEALAAVDRLLGEAIKIHSAMTEATRAK